MRPSPISSLISALPHPGVYGTKARYKACLVLLALCCALAVALAGCGGAAATPDSPESPTTPPSAAPSATSTPASTAVAKPPTLTPAAKAAPTLPAAALPTTATARQSRPTVASPATPTLTAAPAADPVAAAAETAVPAPSPTPPFSVEKQRAALVAIYNATDGPNWTENSNWLSDAPLDQWAGVTTNDTGSVIKLELWTNNLRGELPAELADLVKLEELDVSDNQLSDCLPFAMRRNFRNLNLSGTQFCPSPDRAALMAIYEATNGRKWRDRTNWLKEDVPISEWYGVRTDENGYVIRLALSGNDLSGAIPTELGNLSNLQFLSISNRRLSGEIPAELGNLANLQSLSLSGTQLSGEIPAELGNLANLQSLNLSGTSLAGRYQRSWAICPTCNLWPLSQRIERGDTGGVGQPFQPESSEPLFRRYRGPPVPVLFQPIQRVCAKKLGKPVKPFSQERSAVCYLREGVVLLQLIAQARDRNQGFAMGTAALLLNSTPVLQASSGYEAG